MKEISANQQQQTSGGYQPATSGIGPSALTSQLLNYSAMLQSNSSNRLLNSSLSSSLR